LCLTCTKFAILLTVNALCYASVRGVDVRWLITGGSGQLGKCLIESLNKLPHEVFSPSSNELNLTSPKSIQRAFKAFSPDVVVNAAAWTDVDGAEHNLDLSFAINAIGAGNMAQAAKDGDSLFFQISTDYVFSGLSDLPWQESSKPNPNSQYGFTKAVSEQYCRELYPTGTYIIRTAWLYSKFGRNFPKTMLRLANEKTDVNVVCDQIGQPTYCWDLCDQILLMAESKPPIGIYHGTNSGQATWYEFAQEIFKLAGADVGRVNPVSSSEYPRPAKRPSYSVLSHDAWEGTSVKPLRDWRIALAEALPAIISAVKTEG
jgi:dTDP-4-dehydrorhamnose reductase